MAILRGELPDLFTFVDGHRVRTADDWRRRREAWREPLHETGYGHLPPTPEAVRGEELHRTTVAAMAGVTLTHYRLVIEGGRRPFWFTLRLLIPPGDGPFPVVLCGDACWAYVTAEVQAEVLGRGYALATFNRTEIVPDMYTNDRDTALYLVYPDGDFGALAAWAWGYHRVVDFLAEQPWVEAERIAVVGHSRGGKTVLLAGATDERIALTAPNNSGCGGAGCYRWRAEGCETLDDILRAIPYWFSRHLPEYLGREDELPFDQHVLKALVAPRALLSTEALGDLWANPSGTWQTFDAAREVYRFLGATDRLGIWYREGPHAHGLVDWQVFLDFADQQLRGAAPARRYDVNPFPDMPRAFAWSAPEPA